MKKYILSTVVVVMLSVVGVVFSAHAVQQFTYKDIFGYAWSSNIGWVSFSSAERSADPGGGGLDEVNSGDHRNLAKTFKQKVVARIVDVARAVGINSAHADGSYSVKVSNTGQLSGYAWSDHIGWIKFGSLSGFPTNGAPGANASVNLATGAVTGWIRACGGTIPTGASMDNYAPGDCTTSTPRTDGWDGWIELSGPNHVTGDVSGNGGVTMNPVTGDFKGSAWGGEVVGWLKFDTSGSGVQCPTCTSGGTLTASCSAAPTGPLSPGTSVTFSSVATGGTAPYQYNWSNNPGYQSSAQSQPKVYNSSGAGVTLSVKDAVNAVVSPTCPDVTVNTATTNLKLWVGSASNQNRVTYKVHPGSRAPLFWTSQGMANGDSCQSYVVSGPTTDIPMWANGGVRTNNNPTTPYRVVMPMLTGIYTLAIQCSTPPDTEGNTSYVPVNPGDATYNGQPIQAKVNIEVTNQIIIEI